MKKPLDCCSVSKEIRWYQLQHERMGKEHVYFAGQFRTETGMWLSRNVLYVRADNYLYIPTLSVK